MERQALGDAIKRYNAAGLEKLFDHARPGRPRKLDAAQEKELSELLMKGPDPDKDGISAYTLGDLLRSRRTASRSVPILARKPGALRNGAPFKDRMLPQALERVRRCVSRFL